MEYYYIFYMVDDCNVYERTCGSKESADNRLIELKKFYKDAFYFKDEIPKDLKWFY